MYVTNDASTTVHYAVICLRPGDYHQVHAPCDCTIEQATHFSGELLPVGGGMLPGIRGHLLLEASVRHHSLLQKA